MPVFTGAAAAFTAISTWFATLSPLAAFGVRIAVGLAFNALARALAGDPPQAPRRGITGQLQQGADLPRAFILGRSATAGSLVYHNQWGGATNEYYTRVTALSDLPVSGLVEVWIDGQRCTLDTGNPDPDGKGFPVVELSTTRTVTKMEPSELPGHEGEPGFEAVDTEVTDAFAWVKFYDGTQTAADDFLIDDVATEERPWTAADIGRGVAYAVTTFKFNPELFNAFPQIIYVIDGVALYDPETDDTGTGDGLPMVQAYNLLKGLSWNGAWFYGPQTPAHLSDAEVAAEVAKCRAAVPGTSGMSDADKIAAFGSTTVPSRYRSGLEVRVDTPVADVIEDVLSACNGRASFVGVRYRLQVGDPGASVATVGDGDIITTDKQSFSPFFPLAETVNGVTATYPEPDENWQTQEAPPLFNLEYEAADGDRRLTTTVELRAVPYREQVQRIMASALAEARRARRHSEVWPSSFFPVEPGDVITRNSTRNGYTDKLFRVDGAVDLPNGDLQVDLTEIDPADYSWTAASDYQVVATGSITDQPRPVNTVSGFVVEAIQIRDETGGGRRPAISIRWTPPARDVLNGLFWQVRVKATARVVAAGAVADEGLGAAIISDGILPAVEYQVRARYHARRRPTAWTAWTDVTTDDLRIGQGDLDDDLSDRIDEAFTRHDDTVADATGTIAELRDLIISAFGPLVVDFPTIPLIERFEVLVPEAQDIADRLDLVAEQVGFALSSLQNLGQRQSDAGIFVDPETGKARIAALDGVENRLSQVAIDLDAANAAISLKATLAQVNQIVSEAVLDPSQIPLIDDLELRLSEVEILADANAAAITLKASTTEVDGIDTRLTTAEASIDSLGAAITLKVDQSEFDAAETRLTTAETQLSALDGASITQLVIDTRQVFDEIDATQFATFNALWAAFAERRALQESIAFVQTQIYARVDDDLAAEAGARQTIAVTLAQAQAAIQTEQSVRAAADAAQASDITQLQVDLIVAEGAIAGNASALSSLTTTVTNQGSTITTQGSAITQLQSDLSTAEGQIAGNASALSSLTTTVTGQGSTITAQGSAITQLQSDLTAAESGIAGNASALSSLTTTVTGQGSTITAQGSAITQLQSDLTAAESGIAGNASAISALTTTVTSQGGTITAQGSAITQLQSDLTTAEGSIAGNASAISGLNTTVTGQGASITALSARADILEASTAGGQVIANGDFAQGDLRGWSSVPAAFQVIARGATSADAVVNAPRAWILSIDFDSVNRTAIAADGVPVTPGEVFTPTLWCATYVPGNSTAAVILTFYDGTGAEVGEVTRSQAFTGSTWTQVTLADVTAPAGAATMRVRLRRVAGGSGKLYVARVMVQREALAARDARARITTIEGAYVDADGAVAAIETEISAEFGSLTAMASAAAFAEAGVDGIAAGYIWKVNGSNLLELVSVQYGTDGPVSTFKIAADYVQITGLTQIDDAVIGSLAVSDAFLDNVTIGRGQITNTLESDDYTQDGSGFPLTGLRLNFATGKIKAAGGVITRSIEKAAGSFSPAGPITVNPASGLYLVQAWDLVPTGIEVPVNTVWMASEKTYIATAAFSGGATVVGAFTGDNEFWGCRAYLQPFARWNGPQQLYLRVELWAKGINLLHAAGDSGAAGEIFWKLYEVT